MALEWDDACMPTWPGCELPSLITSNDAPPALPISADGAAHFGDVLVATGSGRVAPDPSAPPNAPAAVTCRLRVQLSGVLLGGDGGGGGAEVWETVWEREVLFSDDSAHLARVAEMSQAQRQHAAEAQVW